MASSTIKVNASVVMSQRNISATTISGLVIDLIGQMTATGVYCFSGSWENHSSGYTAMAMKKPYYDSGTSGDRYSGIVFEYSDGSTYSFTAASTSNYKINKLQSAT